MTGPVAANDNPCDSHEQQVAALLFQLGLMADRAVGEQRDLIAAHKWMTIAAMRGSGPARSYRQQLAREMTAIQVGEAHRQAREWLMQ